MFTVLVFGAVAIATHASPSNATEAPGWNAIVGADFELFDSEVDPTVSHSSTDKTILLEELDQLLQNSSTLNAVYNNYLVHYKKHSLRLADLKVKAQFKENLLKIAEHNVDAKLGKYMWTEGVNGLTDMSIQEITNHVSYSGSLSKLQPKSGMNESKLHFSAHSESVNWRNSLTKVRNQGHCGSVPTFVLVSQLEAQYVINGGQKLVLSVQQVEDCTFSGCHGGFLDSNNVLKLLEHGIALESVYPDHLGVCNDTISPAGPKLLTVKYSSDNAGLKNDLQSGPVFVAVNAVCPGFVHYKSGIFKGCTSTRLNHALLAVGYDKEQDYYDLLNTWGEDWGNKGFIRIRREAAGIGNYNIAITSN